MVEEPGDTVTVIRNTLYGVENLEETAIELIQKYGSGGVRVAFSGGKDSVVIYDLVLRSGVPARAHYSQTTVDPPEVQKFIKDNYPDVEWIKPRRSMFKLIEEKGFLPTRVKRYCCEELKEIGKKGQIIVLGIRSDESSSRRKRKEYEESTRTPGLFFINPILSWTDRDVWQYIKDNDLPYCSLYDLGYSRIGCIMCPLQGSRGMELDSERYPKFHRAYINAVERLIQRYPDKYYGHSAEEIIYRWIWGNWPDTQTVQTQVVIQ